MVLPRKRPGLLKSFLTRVDAGNRDEVRVRRHDLEPVPALTPTPTCTSLMGISKNRSDEQHREPDDHHGHEKIAAHELRWLVADSNLKRDQHQHQENLRPQRTSPQELESSSDENRSRGPMPR